MGLFAPRHIALIRHLSALHSAACGPQPKAAIPRWSGFDLESRDLHPDDPVNHRDGAAMNGFVDLHGESVTGVIETFDRVIFKGHLNRWGVRPLPVPAGDFAEG